MYYIKQLMEDVFMKIKNLANGYIIIEIFGRRFVYQLPENVKLIHEIENIDNKGKLTTLCHCETRTGHNDYIKFLDLSFLLTAFNVDYLMCGKISVS